MHLSRCAIADPTLRPNWRFNTFLKSRLKSNARTSHVMSRFASVFVAALLSLCWHVSVESVYVDIPVQLAFSVDDYLSFGSINGDLQENVSCAVTWWGLCVAPSDCLVPCVVTTSHVNMPDMWY